MGDVGGDDAASFFLRFGYYNGVGKACNHAVPLGKVHAVGHGVKRILRNDSSSVFEYLLRQFPVLIGIHHAQSAAQHSDGVEVLLQSLLVCAGVDAPCQATDNAYVKRSQVFHNFLHHIFSIIAGIPRAYNGNVFFVVEAFSALIIKEIGRITAIFQPVGIVLVVKKTDFDVVFPRLRELVLDKLTDGVVEFGQLQVRAVAVQLGRRRLRVFKHHRRTAAEVYQFLDGGISVVREVYQCQSVKYFFFHNF